MNEIVAATNYGGISRDDLNRKWTKSCKNDYDGKPITERTFFRIIANLKELFECEIICSKTSQKYYLIIDDEESNTKEMTLLEILRQKASHSSVNQILQMLVAGNDIPDNDMRSARDLAAAVSRLPQIYSEEFLNNAKNITGADMAEEDEYYRNYICVWNNAVYHRTSQWLSIGFYDNEVCFYAMTNEPNPAERSRKAAEAGFGEGVRYRGGYYWHEPTDPELFTVPFGTKPDMKDVVRRAELLISRLEKVQTFQEKNH